MKTSTLLQSSDFAERQLGLVLRAFGYVSTNQPTGDLYALFGLMSSPPRGNARQRRRLRRDHARVIQDWHASNPENICPSWTAGDYKDER